MYKYEKIVEEDIFPLIIQIIKKEPQATLL